MIDAVSRWLPRTVGGLILEKYAILVTVHRVTAVATRNLAEDLTAADDVSIGKRLVRDNFHVSRLVAIQLFLNADWKILLST